MTKSLHICNVANVAYANCKILNSLEGQSAELICHDLNHLMSQPEWYDLDLSSDSFPDEYNFYNNNADFGDYKRPSWYTTDNVLNYHRNQLFLKINKQLPSSIKNVLRPIYTQFSKITSKTKQLFTTNEKDRLYTHLWEKRIKELINYSKRYGAKWELTAEDLSLFKIQMQWLRDKLNTHEVIYAYVLSPIYAMLLGNHPYVSIEIGTMRDIPFDGTSIGKCLALAYRLSHHVLITNPDVRPQAEALGIKSYSFCPHPIDENYFSLKPSDELQLFKQSVVKDRPVDLILFAPARQNWAIKGNHKMFHAIRKLLDQNIKALLIVPGWGQEVERSKKLCEDLNITGWVDWIKPLSEPATIKYYQISDAVLDQFVLDTFGLATGKALSCQKPVITSIDFTVNDWCFPDRPPVIPAKEVEEIHQALVDLHMNPEKKLKIGEESRQWVLKNHSKYITAKKLIEAMHIAKQNFNMYHL